MKIKLLEKDEYKEEIKSFKSARFVVDEVDLEFLYEDGQTPS